MASVVYQAVFLSLGSSGHVTFTDLKWRSKNKYYIFRADAITDEGEDFTLRRKFLPGMNYQRPSQDLRKSGPEIVKQGHVHKF